MTNIDFCIQALFKFSKSAKEKDKTLSPWDDHDFEFLRERLRQEVQELDMALFHKNREGIMEECLDVANFAWIIWEKARTAKGGKP